MWIIVAVVHQLNYVTYHEQMQYGLFADRDACENHIEAVVSKEPKGNKPMFLVCVPNSHVPFSHKTK